jgi:hypothetical protein
MTVAHWRNNQTSDGCIGGSQHLRNTASICAGSDIEFRCNFLVSQLNQDVATWRLTQNGL